MVDAHSHEVLCARLLVEIHQMLGIELVGRPDLADILVAELRRMAESRDVILILLAALNINVARVPVAVLGSRLRSPMRPDAKLRVAEPFGNLVRLQPLARPVEGPLLDFRNDVLRQRLARDEERGCSGHDSDCVSPADLHNSLSPVGVSARTALVRIPVHAIITPGATRSATQGVHEKRTPSRSPAKSLESGRADAQGPTRLCGAGWHPA